LIAPLSILYSLEYKAFFIDIYESGASFLTELKLSL
jgi:hypothetical protein